MKTKTVNALMKYLRDKKGIQIEGSSQKQKLRSIGYYHGYKGYRFFSSPSNHLAYTDFNQLLSVYSFDMQVKAILYTPLMQIETALKNYALEEFLLECDSCHFADIYTNILNHHNDFPKGSSGFKEAIKKELSFRNKIYGDLSRDYSAKLVVQHFYDKDQPVPIWAIFETISLGEFGTMLLCVNDKVVKKIAKSVGINSAFNSDGRLLGKIVFTLKDLRNAVAHNDPVFDLRFKMATPNGNIAKLVTNETGVQNITFNTIVDYIVLVTYLMKCLGFTKTEIRKLILDFKNCYEDLRKRVPAHIYSVIIHTDTRSKLQKLETYV